MIDNHVTMEGLFTIVLYTQVKAGETTTEYTFLTNTDGTHRAKSPADMFPRREISNDLQLVLDKVNQFYGTEEVIQPVKV